MPAGGDSLMDMIGGAEGQQGWLPVADVRAPPRHGAGYLLY
jgi:hypothetical protein